MPLFVLGGSVAVLSDLMGERSRWRCGSDLVGLGGLIWWVSLTKGLEMRRSVNSFGE